MDINAEQRKIEEKFAAAATQSFGQHCDFMVASGSFAYGGARKGISDLDTLLVFDEGIKNIPKPDKVAMAIDYGKRYFDIHKEHGYCPDLHFPGEYITRANVADALAGRGFEPSEDGLLYLPKASDQYYLADTERYFRAWRSMLTFGKLIAGSQSDYFDTKLTGWEIVILYILQNFNGTEIDSEQILDILTKGQDKWQGVGVTQRYLTFREDERIFIEQALMRLRLKNVLSGNVNKSFSFSRDCILEAARHISTSVSDGSVKKSGLFLDKVDSEIVSEIVREHAAKSERRYSTGLLERQNYSVSPMRNVHLGDCIQVVYTANDNDVEENGLTSKEIVVLVKIPEGLQKKGTGTEKPFGNHNFPDEEIPLRISSACLHGSLGDSECNCYPETIDYLRQIADTGYGVFVYLPQDALGRGLRDKVRDHRLIYGVDENGHRTNPLTVEESLFALHPEGYDVRHFSILRKVFQELGLDGCKFRILGHNIAKIDTIQSETNLQIVNCAT